MIRNVISPRRYAIFWFVFLAWSIAATGKAAETSQTNPIAPSGALARSGVLTNAEQVHWLTREEAAAGRQVIIRGVITCALPDFGAAVVQDRTAGIYIDRWVPSLGAPPQLGESVEVEGVTDPGDFAPRVHAVRITPAGHRGIAAAGPSRTGTN